MTIQHTGVPSFFRAACWTASQGGKESYETVGYHFALALWSEQPYEADDDYWAARLDALADYIDAESSDDIWGWFKMHFPKCMKLIPSRRRTQFVRGVTLAHEDVGIYG